MHLPVRRVWREALGQKGETHGEAVVREVGNTAKGAAGHEGADIERILEEEDQLRAHPNCSSNYPAGVETDQWRAYSRIVKTLSQRRPKPLRLLVQASAGTGKSFLLSTVFLWCLIHNKRVGAFAPTGIAAANVEIKGTDVSATTYHHLFGLNAELDSKMDPNKASDPYVQKLSSRDILNQYSSQKK